MRLQKRIEKDNRDVQRKAKNLFNVYASDIGKMIDRAIGDIVGSTAQILAQFQEIDYLTLKSAGIFTRLEHAANSRMTYLAKEISEYWKESQRNFDILSRFSVAFTDRKATPPWLSVTLNLKDKLRLAKDGVPDPRKGHIDMYLGRFSEKILNEIKMGAIKEETLSQILGRIRYLTKKARPAREDEYTQRQVSALQDVLDESFIAEDVTFGPRDVEGMRAPVSIEEGIYTREDISRFIEDLQRANNWEYRQYRPWFSDSIKARNRYLRDLEQILMHDAVQRVQSGKLQIGSKSMGIDDFTWHTSFQETTCEFCGERDELTMSEIKDKIKDKYRDAPPPLHPNCSCSAVPRIKEDWLDEATGSDGEAWDDGRVYSRTGSEIEYGVEELTVDEFIRKFA